MERYYKAEDLIKNFETLRDAQSNYGLHDKAIDTGYYIQMLLAQPVLEFEEPKEGTWSNYSSTMMECSNCKKHVPYHRYQYCPHCGSKNKGVD